MANGVQRVEIRSGTGTAKQLWALSYLDVAAKEAHKCLDDTQYAHAVDLLKQLAEEENPRRSKTLDIQAIEDFFELKDKGGVLGKINLRIYFAVFDDSKKLVVLGAWKKESEGQVPNYIKVRMRSRLRFVRKTVKGQG